jgi:glycerophosphoryl diester phosphodiesterase
MIIIGHRGAAGHAPEHTFRSYDLALEMGADYIEQDLQLTMDGQIVVMHDATLDRTTECTGLVIERTLHEIKQCSPDVPTLRELFERYEKTTRYYIELKNPDEAPGMEQKLLDLLDEFELRDRVIVESFSRESMLMVHEMAPDLPLVQLTDHNHDSAAVRARLLDIKSYAIGVAPNRVSVDAALVGTAHDSDLIVHPYTVNEPAQMKRFMELGVDGMFTDYPDRLKALLEA